jgi:hypothetical protein
LEQYVVELIEARILNPSALCKLKEEIQKHADDPQPEGKTAVTKSLREVEQALKNVTDAIEAGLLSDVLVARLKELEAEKKRLETCASSRYPRALVTEIDIPLILSQYREVKDSPSAPAYKEFIRSFIERIDVGRYSARIVLKTGLDLVPGLDTTVEVRRQEIYEGR